MKRRGSFSNPKNSVDRTAGVKALKTGRWDRTKASVTVAGDREDVGDKGRGGVGSQVLQDLESWKVRILSVTGGCGEGYTRGATSPVLCFLKYLSNWWQKETKKLSYRSGSAMSNYTVITM